MSEKNKSNYNTWSAFYDNYPNPTVAIDELFFPKYYLGEVKQDVLEIGCGTGRHTLRLVRGENTVTAIDMSDGMLAQAKQKVKHGAEFHLGDIMTMDLGSRQFSVVVMSLVLEHISELDVFFKKVKKLIKPGGRFYFSEIHPDRTAKGIMAHFKTPEGDEIHLHSLPHSTESIRTAAMNAHFSVTAIDTITGDNDLLKINSKWEKHLGKPMLQIWVLHAQ